MAEASRAVLDSFQLRTDAHLVKYPANYMDGRGRVMWEVVMRLLDKPKRNPCDGRMTTRRDDDARYDLSRLRPTPEDVEAHAAARRALKKTRGAGDGLKADRPRPIRAVPGRGNHPPGPGKAPGHGEAFRLVVAPELESRPPPAAEARKQDRGTPWAQPVGQGCCTARVGGLGADPGRAPGPEIAPGYRNRTSEGWGI